MWVISPPTLVPSITPLPRGCGQGGATRCAVPSEGLFSAVSNGCHSPVGLPPSLCLIGCGLVLATTWILSGGLPLVGAVLVWTASDLLPRRPAAARLFLAESACHAAGVRCVAARCATLVVVATLLGCGFCCVDWWVCPALSQGKNCCEFACRLCVGCPSRCQRYDYLGGRLGGWGRGESP